MFRKKTPPPRSAPPVSSVDWSDLGMIRREWPADELDPAADLAAWRSGQQTYDGSDDYYSMIRAGALMCQALRHHLYGDGILAAADLPGTVLGVLFASTATPPDGVTLTYQARKQLRLALTVCKKHGWQPVSMGGDETLGRFFEGGMHAHFCAAVAPPNKTAADLRAFFISHPIGVPATGTPQASVSPPVPVQQSASYREEAAASTASTAALENVIAEAGTGEAASQARARGFAADMRGEKQAAVAHYEQAARLGDVGAMFDAGCLNNDLGRKAASTYWWESAAAAGHTDAASNLAACAIRDGNLPLANEWFGKLAELGGSRGFAALTQLAEDVGDAQAALRWSRLGADAGHPFCLVRYSQLLVQANPGDQAVLHQALAMQERAAAMGDANGMFLAGITNGQLGNLAGARRWLEQAEDAGYSRARSFIERYKP